MGCSRSQISKTHLTELPSYLTPSNYPNITSTLPNIKTRRTKPKIYLSSKSNASMGGFIQKSRSRVIHKFESPIKSKKLLDLSLKSGSLSKFRKDQRSETSRQFIINTDNIQPIRLSIENISNNKPKNDQSFHINKDISYDSKCIISNRREESDSNNSFEKMTQLSSQIKSLKSGIIGETSHTHRIKNKKNTLCKNHQYRIRTEIIQKKDDHQIKNFHTYIEYHKLLKKMDERDKIQAHKRYQRLNSKSRIFREINYGLENSFHENSYKADSISIQDKLSKTILGKTRSNKLISSPKKRRIRKKSQYSNDTKNNIINKSVQINSCVDHHQQKMLNQKVNTKNEDLDY